MKYSNQELYFGLIYMMEEGRRLPDDKLWHALTSYDLVSNHDTGGLTTAWTITTAGHELMEEFSWNLISLAEGISLDEIVNSMKAVEATAINNGGPAKQIIYLIEVGGKEWVEGNIRALQHIAKA